MSACDDEVESGGSGPSRVMGGPRMTDSPRYTPAQILEMGHRAEHEGNLEYATQFYSYLADNLAGAPEAVDARLALERLSHLHESHPEPGPVHPQHAQSVPAGHDEVPRTSAPSHPPTEVVAHSIPEPASYGTRPAAPQPAPHVAQPNDIGEEEAKFVPGYWLGRFLAFTLQLLGWLVLLGGFIFIALQFTGVVVSDVAAPIGGLPSGLLLSVSAIAAGLALVFIGLLAQATFEAANNTREILEIERVKAGW